jgi:hypothetical protein
VSVLALPRAQQVAIAKELSSIAAIHPDASEQQALEHEQADAITDQSFQLRPVPATTAQTHNGSDALLDGRLPAGWLERLSEVGVLSEDVADPRRGRGLTGHDQTIWQTSGTTATSSGLGPGWGSCPVRDVDGWQVTYLVLGEVELYAVIDAGDGAERDGHSFLAPEVSVVQQDVCHVMIARIDR